MTPDEQAEQAQMCLEQVCRGCGFVMTARSSVELRLQMIDHANAAHVAGFWFVMDPHVRMWGQPWQRERTT